MNETVMTTKKTCRSHYLYLISIRHQGLYTNEENEYKFLHLKDILNTNPTG